MFCTPRRHHLKGSTDSRQRPSGAREGGDLSSSDGTENINAGTPPDRPDPYGGPSYVIKDEG